MIDCTCDTATLLSSRYAKTRRNSRRSKEKFNYLSGPSLSDVLEPPVRMARPFLFLVIRSQHSRQMVRLHHQRLGKTRRHQMRFEEDRHSIHLLCLQNLQLLTLHRQQLPRQATYQLGQPRSGHRHHQSHPTVLDLFSRHPRGYLSLGLDRCNLLSSLPSR